VGKHSKTNTRFYQTSWKKKKEQEELKNNINLKRLKMKFLKNLFTIKKNENLFTIASKRINKTHTVEARNYG
jgi:hypothetical protein